MSTEATETSTEGAERRLSRTRYPHIVSAVFDTPWAILETRLKAIIEIVELRAAGGRLSAEELEERIGAGPASRQTSAQGAVAVIPIYGVIMPRATLFSQISGGTSLTTFAEQLQGAVDDQQIGSILLDIDSPGGSSALVAETAALIRAANQKKPVTAIANTMAASAAYWLMSQAGEKFVTPSGYVGSIGVYMAHEDFSAFDEKVGVKTTLISAGKYKVEGNEFEPLSDEAEARYQAVVDDCYAAFVADVAKGQGVAIADVRNGFGEGRVLTAREAVSEGLVDGVATFDQVLGRMLRGGQQGSRAKALALAAESDAGEEAREEIAPVEEQEDREPADAEPAFVEGAEALSRRAAVREHFAPASAGSTSTLGGTA
jgi:signal peptide peptidase SppA